jgi:hypothetical protein
VGNLQTNKASQDDSDEHRNSDEHRIALVQ